ncbi:MAG: DUF3253 domain-containing protein [Bacteriovorax sp.]|nr:DUF3253 domain-containing protein [Bacteriovorax sp.]
MMKNNIEDLEIEDTIIELLLVRGTDKTICPSEVVRQLYPENWRDKMDAVRRVAGNLVQENILIITHKNQQVDVNVKGPIRLKLKA